MACQSLPSGKYSLYRQAFAFEPAAGNDADAAIDTGLITDNDRRRYVGQQNEKRPDA